MAARRPSAADLRIEAACDRFEAAWRAGQAPRMEDFLAAVRGPECPPLFGELLALELELRRTRGEDPSLAEYLGRFPDLAETVRDTFGTRSAGVPSTGVRESAARALLFATGPRFTILRAHARGGLGEVFVARDAELNREVALKRIQPGFAHDPACRARFVLEAEITGGLEHPGIVPVYGLGASEDGQPYYAMRFIQGDSLKDAIDAYHGAEPASGERALAFRRLLQRFIAVCEAVAYAHSRGVLHRDLKPGNVLLGRFGETLLVDWGLAKPLVRREGPAVAGESTPRPAPGSGSTPTLQGTALGTPAYMSPEQAAGRLDELGPATDVYGLGATLYYLLTGRAPFSGPDLDQVLRDVQRGDFPPPRAAQRAVPAPLEAVCLKAMAHLPADRYASPTALREDLEHWLADEPVTVWREPIRLRARRWARRHRPAVTAGIATVLAGVVGLAAVVAVQARANDRLQGAYSRTNQALAETKQAKQAADLALAETKQAKQAADLALAESKRAKQATDAALTQSEESRRRAEAVLSFLKDDVLSATRPKGQEGGLGWNVTVREALDAAAPRIAARFQGQPLVEADLRQTLGETYRYAGVPYRQVEQHARAFEVRRTLLGPDHPSTLGSAYFLAMAYRAAGRAAEALTLDEETLKRSEATLGSDHTFTLAMRINLASDYRDAGRLTEAIALHEAALQRQAVHLGPNHQSVLSGLDNLAGDYLAAGRFQRAIDSFEATLKMREKTLGPDHPDTFTSLGNIASAYRRAGRFAEALTKNEACFQAAEVKLGPDHPGTLLYRANLADAYVSVGRITEGVALLQSSLARMESTLGPDHPQVLAVRNNLAAHYESAERLTEAIALHEATLQMRESKLGRDHPDTLTSRNNLAVAYHAASRIAAAVPLYETNLRAVEARYGAEHPYTLTSRANLAAIYESQGRWPDAEPFRRALLARRKATEKPDSLKLSGDYAQLGVNLTRQGRWAEAEPLLRESLKIQERGPALVWVRFLTMSQLGGNLLEQGRYAEAEPFVVKGCEELQKRLPLISAKLPRSRHVVLRSAEHVIQLYTRWGKPEKAAEWKRKLNLADLPTDVFARP